MILSYQASTFLDREEQDVNDSKPASTDAAGALAEIQRRQAQVIDAVLVPGWYWWVVAVAMVAIGAAADTKRPVVLAVAIPVAVLVIAGLTVAMIVGAYRRVQVHSRTLLGGRGAIAIVGLDWLVVGVGLGTAFGLRAAGSRIPGTIGTTAGAVVLVIAGPAVMRYLRGLMLSQRAGGTAWSWRRQSAGSISDPEPGPAE